MTKEFNLSERIVEDEHKSESENDYDWIYKEDIKEFIELRNELDWELDAGNITWEEYIKKRDKLAGDGFK